MADEMTEHMLILGVGSGRGNLFVHGNYESIKAAQTLIFELEEARRELKALRRIVYDR